MSMQALDNILRPLIAGDFLGAREPSHSPRAITLDVLERLVGPTELREVNFRLWDGTIWPDREQNCRATIVLTQPGALREILLSSSETEVGEAYLTGAFVVDGDLEAAFELADWLMEKTQGWTAKLHLAHRLRQLPRVTTEDSATCRGAGLGGSRHSRQRDREAISLHYDVSNDFYALWLDRQMAYSCAYFRQPADDLDTAQQNKFDLICRKLGLKPGDSLLDIGCGWGGLICHAARHYGVHAVGITLSRQQLDYAREKIERERLTAQVTAHLLDYRDLPVEETYDAISSVGMVEHVGRENLPVYFETIHALLRPGALFLNHGIGLGPVEFPGNSGAFIQDQVFPDSDLIPIHQMVHFAEKAGWEVRDVESLREHYAMTLRRWGKHLLDHEEQAQELVGTRAYRTWRLYMAGCAHNFQTGRLSIYQTLLAKPDSSGTSRIPATRAGWS